MALQSEIGRSCSRNSASWKKQSPASTTKPEEKNFLKNLYFFRRTQWALCQPQMQNRNSTITLPVTQLHIQLEVCVCSSCACGCNCNYCVHKTGIGKFLVTFSYFWTSLFLLTHLTSRSLIMTVIQVIHRRSQWWSVLLAVTF